MSALHVAERSAVYALEDAVTPVADETFDLLATAPQGVAKLRELILSLAVAGRLVPHDQDDEPATDLLERICAEKRRRVELGELSSRALRNTSTERDTPNAPENWAWSSLAQIGIINPRNSAPDDTLASFAPMTVIPISMRDRLHTEERKWADIKSGFTHFAEGDVGVAKITPCFQNGKSVVFRDLVNGIGAGTTELHVVRPLCGVVPEYVLVFLKSPAFLMNGEAEMTGTAGQRRLPRTYFENVPFPLPPLAEQRRIVARVEELMGLCDELEARGRLQDGQHARLVATLFGALVASTSPAELADNWQRVARHFDLLLDRPAAVDALEQTILQLAIRGLLVPQDPTDEPASALLAHINATRRQLVARGASNVGREPSPISAHDIPFDLPKGWEPVRLGTLGTLGSSSRVHQRDWVASGVPFYRAREIVKLSKGEAIYNPLCITDGLFKELSKGNRSPEVGDVMITGVGTIGVPYVVKRTDRFYFKDASVLIFKNRYNLDPEFVCLFMLSPYWIRNIHSESMGTTVDTLTIIRATEVPVPLPPLAEQHRIVARVEELRSLCANLRQHLQQAQATQSNLADALVARAAA